MLRSAICRNNLIKAAALPSRSKRTPTPTCRLIVVQRRLTSNKSSNHNAKKTAEAVKPDTITTTPSPCEDWTAFPKAFAVGTVAGAMGSLAGMGGGFVMIPMMTSSLLRLTQHQAHGTSLFAVMATGAAGAVSYGDAVEWEPAFVVAICGMITARLGAQTTALLSGRSLKKALGVLMLAMAPAVPIKAYYLKLAEEKDRERKQLHSEDEGNQTSDEEPSLPPYISRLVAPASIGLGSGFLAGLFGVGGGTLVVPALTVFCDMTHYQALGTSLAAMTLPAATGTYTHWAAGNVAMRVAPGLACGAFAGAYMGGQLGLKTNESVLRWGFSGLLATLGIKIIMKS